ncbi:hypothetical protein Aple_064550 [Acrocarpospora pleiomorpha]|uniref:Uncharacterized protein n=1 Tax=Acrocarpospora pleiomorpha TaxID=90975 RepID=A0A5M3XRY8_9ACTN|nr:hypothetical protein [Acrocarpospora pleiomorpha]GES23556.1 hypothetical protein Aple_064550 [Acrocarpospora pleiomorpha]
MTPEESGLELAVALISAGAAIVGVVVGILGAGVQQWTRHRKHDRDAYEKALQDVLTGAAMFQLSLQVFRAAWHGRLIPGTRTKLANDSQHILLPAMGRILDALTLVTLSRARRHRPLVRAAGPLTDAVGELTEALGQNEAVYTRKREAYNEALSAFRREVDLRRV